MEPPTQSALQWLRHFPKGHVLACAALAAIVTLALALAPDDATSTAMSTRALALPSPEQLSPASNTLADDAPSDTPTTAVAAASFGPDWHDLTVQSGDTLSALLQSIGVSISDVHRLVTADERLKALTRLRVGDVVRAALNDDGQLIAVEYRLSQLKSLSAEHDGEQWAVTEHERQYDRQIRYAEATITDSLFMSGHRAGMTDNLIMQFANIFAWDVDFALDIREGDTFRVMFEELYVDGEKVGTGNILRAEFLHRGKHLTALRYDADNGQGRYLDDRGNALRRAFIRTPVEFARISSRFNPGRRHPILNTLRAHRGVDYAAPTGTPIRATGDGRVEFVGSKNGYGNTVVIKHGQQYSTLYAHMSRFAGGLRSGQQVRQGQTIGYVGMTGLATGPHLHYEFHVNGSHRDPLTVQLPMAQGISSQERPAFLARAEALKQQMDMHRHAFAFARNEP